jgi:serine/threonine-protein kinase PknK
MGGRAPSLLQSPRRRCAAVVGDKIVVVGGRTGNPEQLFTQTEVYDGTYWRDAADIPVPGNHLAVTAASSYLYAVGGRKFSASSNTHAVQRYDPKANRWTALTPTPQPVGGAGAAIVKGQLIIVGGETPSSVSGNVQAYDLTAPPPLGPPCPPSTRAATASGSPPSAIPSTPSAVPPKSETPHPPNSS